MELDTYLDLMDGVMIVESARMTDRKSTVAEVDIFIGDLVFSASGSSRRVGEDAYDPDLGDLLAYTRALDRILAQMKAKGKKMMKAVPVSE
jgi:hypothetical protein